MQAVWDSNLLAMFLFGLIFDKIEFYKKSHMVLFSSGLLLKFENATDDQKCVTELKISV